jgi:hypothetical protein
MVEKQKNFENALLLLVLPEVGIFQPQYRMGIVIILRLLFSATSYYLLPKRHFRHPLHHFGSGCRV